jgi:deazaflavin-dependent oxidoreductase (nitroreductase family)
VRRLCKGIGVVIVVLGGCHIVLMLAFAGGSERAAGVVRRLNKWTLNPVMLRFAGRKGFYAAAIHHVGRSSGRLYATPVVAEPAPGGFVVPLPYGTGVDWLRNLRAAGSARLVVDGSTVVVGRPEIIPAAEAARFLPCGMKRLLDWQGVSSYLRLEFTDPE